MKKTIIITIKKLPFYSKLRVICLFIVQNKYRHEVLTLIKHKSHILQINGFTSRNRYPDLFQMAKEYFVAKNIAPKLMSFGCSTGEEVISLKDYMINASIVGVDINEYALTQCRKKCKHPDVDFINYLSEKFNTVNEFNAIFCLAVFQHPINRKLNQQQAQNFTFEKFESTLKILDTKLKVDGLIFITNTDFNFLDTTIAKNYAPLDVENNRLILPRPLYNTNNKLIAKTSDLFRVFIKLKNI